MEKSIYLLYTPAEIFSVYDAYARRNIELFRRRRYNKEKRGRRERAARKEKRRTAWKKW